MSCLGQDERQLWEWFLCVTSNALQLYHAGYWHYLHKSKWEMQMFLIWESVGENKSWASQTSKSVTLI